MIYFYAFLIPLVIELVIVDFNVHHYPPLMINLKNYRYYLFPLFQNPLMEVALPYILDQECSFVRFRVDLH
jgi:hypothetical protein